MPSGNEPTVHGYLSGPASRQAQCAAGATSCGQISYEPQSVEGPKGQRNCSAGRPDFAELDDDGKSWAVHEVSGTVDFTWTLTALRRTLNYEYYIGGRRVGFVDAGNVVPDSTTQTHKIDLSGFSGRQKLLAIWNVGDSDDAFYSCVDLDLGTADVLPPSAPTLHPPV